MAEEAKADGASGSMLRSCKLCGKEVSPYSPFCRNCGHPRAPVLAVWVVSVFLFLVFALYVAIALWLSSVYRFRTHREPDGRVEREVGPTGRAAERHHR